MKNAPVRSALLFGAILSLVIAAPGAAHEPGSAPEVYAPGFTQITDLAFGRDGSLYVLEIATGSRAGPPTPGALIRATPDGSRLELAQGALTSQTGSRSAAARRTCPTPGPRRASGRWCASRWAITDRATGTSGRRAPAPCRSCAACTA
jgi:hypothetical protein